MDVGVRLVRRASEKTADFLRGHVGDYLGCLVEVVINVGYVVCLHHRHHHFFVDGERNKHFCAFHYGGPVLVADGVAEFYGVTDNFLGRERGEFAEVDFKHGVESQAEHYHFFLVGFEIHDVAVGNLALAAQGYGVFDAEVACGEETAFLGCPLVEDDRLNGKAFGLSRPFGRVDISSYFTKNSHGG